MPTYADAPRGRAVTVLASAARTATPTAETFNSSGARSLVVVIDVTVATASPSVVAKDIVPANWTVTAVHADADSITYTVGASLS
jgi:hypothetical protein